MSVTSNGNKHAARLRGNNVIAGNNDVDDKRRKPLTHAPPPAEAVASMVVLLLVFWGFLPSREEIQNESTPDMFVRRLFPEYVTVETLILTRLLFGCFCASVTLYALLFATSQMVPTYLRPQSKLADTTITMEGVLLLYPFTSWSWILLGIQFLLSSYATWCIHNNNHTPPSSWLLSAVLTLWKISAPMTLLIGAVVKYALWPMALKKNGPHHVYKHVRPLIQHNLNVVMALVECLLMGGGYSVPIRHISFPIIYGIAYIFFSWSTMKHLNPNTGPASLYFFMDTTLGRTHTKSLFALLGVLLLFYSIFSFVGVFVEHVIGDEAGIGMHVALLLFLCALTCRFQD